MYEIVETVEYREWLDQLTLKERAQVHARVTRIRAHGHFGVVKKLNTRLAELKWKNGRRVYFTVAQDIKGKLVILLIGGSKNSQSKDIRKAKSILEKLIEGN